MGLLDDAIREHLELKRRHGADPTEVARQEQEALGPARRAEFAQPAGAEPAPPGEAAAEAPAAEAAPHADVPAEPADAPPEGEAGPIVVAPEDDARPGVVPPQGDVGPADVVPAVDEPTKEDVLEETPEFLQETPEHDRLWFEQKPPRDFDWDH